MLAKELAKVKISSRLTEQELETSDKDSPSVPASTTSASVKTVKADMFVEDAVSAQGPIVIEVNPAITVAELKVQVEKEFEIPVNVQKWILGKQLVVEDTVTLSSQGISADGDKIYLYLVNPEEEKKESEPVASSPPQTTQKIPLVLPTEPHQKGRYWNYEMERWSFCNSDDDEDRQEEIRNIDQAVDNAATKDEAKADEEEEEWEYYYDDVDIKPKNDNEAAPQPVEAAPAPAPAVTKTQVDGWECPVCTLVNPLERPGCSACTTERPADLGAAAVLQEKQEEVKQDKPNTGLDMYKQLENLDIIPNAETFECTICYLETEPGDGVVLRECLHTFCK